MMDLDKLLKTTPESLAKLQYDLLKDHAISVLRKALTLMEKGEPEKIAVFFSPAGGGGGCDNHCIDFSIPGSGVTLDIEEVTERLISLKNIIQKGKKP